MESNTNQRRWHFSIRDQFLLIVIVAVGASYYGLAKNARHVDGLAMPIPPLPGGVLFTLGACAMAGLCRQAWDTALLWPRAESGQRGGIAIAVFSAVGIAATYFGFSCLAVLNLSPVPHYVTVQKQGYLFAMELIPMLALLLAIASGRSIAPRKKPRRKWLSIPLSVLGMVAAVVALIVVAFANTLDPHYANITATLVELTYSPHSPIVPREGSDILANRTRVILPISICLGIVGIALAAIWLAARSRTSRRGWLLWILATFATASVALSFWRFATVDFRRALPFLHESLGMDYGHGFWALPGVRHLSVVLPALVLISAAVASRWARSGEATVSPGAFTESVDEIAADAPAFAFRPNPYFHESAWLQLAIACVALGMGAYRCLAFYVQIPFGWFGATILEDISWFLLSMEYASANFPATLALSLVCGARIWRGFRYRELPFPPLRPARASFAAFAAAWTMLSVVLLVGAIMVVAAGATSWMAFWLM